MAIAPAEIYCLTDQEREIAGRIEQKLDEAILATMKGKYALCYPVEKHTPPASLYEVSRRFRLAGWNVAVLPGHLILEAYPGFSLMSAVQMTVRDEIAAQQRRAERRLAQEIGLRPGRRERVCDDED